jgi:hypothetical protein
MRKVLAASLLLLASAACSSQGGNTAASSIKPEVQIVQTSGVPSVARFEQGALRVQYALRVSNPSAEPITLKRVTLVSQSEGAYHVGPVSQAYDVTIAPGAHEEVQMSADATTGQSIVGANGPVMLRVTTEFNSAAGKFQQITNSVVNANASITGEKDQ